jgi:hypothetical protein
MSKSKSITEFITSQVIIDHTSWELQELIDRMPENTEEAASDFCGAFDLGNWFYDAMILNDIDISEVLIDTAQTRRSEEKEAADDQAEIERDYQRSQGWPA